MFFYRRTTNPFPIMLQVVAKLLTRVYRTEKCCMGGTNSHYFLSQEWSWYIDYKTQIFYLNCCDFYLGGSHENSTVSFSVTIEQFGWMTVDKRVSLFFFQMQSPPIKKINIFTFLSHRPNFKTVSLTVHAGRIISCVSYA